MKAAKCQRIVASYQLINSLIILSSAKILGAQSVAPISELIKNQQPAAITHSAPL
jgi:hypothetical protein